MVNYGVLTEISAFNLYKWKLYQAIPKITKNEEISWAVSANKLEEGAT